MQDQVSCWYKATRNIIGLYQDRRSSETVKQVKKQEPALICHLQLINMFFLQYRSYQLTEHSTMFTDRVMMCFVLHMGKTKDNINCNWYRIEGIFEPLMQWLVPPGNHATDLIFPQKKNDSDHKIINTFVCDSTSTLQQQPDWLWGPHNPLSNECWGLFPMHRACRRWRWLSNSL